MSLPSVDDLPQIKWQAKLEPDGTFWKKTSQPTENIILERNQRLRRGGNPQKDLSWGRQVANIPFIMWEKAIRNGFGLNCPDGEIRQKEVFRFLQSEDGKKCLTRDSF